MEELKNWLGLIAVAISVGGFIWNHLTSSGTKALAEVGKLRTDVAGFTERTADEVAKIEKRVQHVEGELKHLPDGDAAHRLELAVEKLSGQLAVLEERMKPIAAINARLQEWTLERGK